jgi:hypothetical protein
MGRLFTELHNSPSILSPTAVCRQTERHGPRQFCCEVIVNIQCWGDEITATVAPSLTHPVRAFWILRGFRSEWFSMKTEENENPVDCRSVGVELGAPE